ncbi:MAG: ATP-dependent DNA helicase RecG [Rhodospirillaceae bacterium]|nr:ATP-dependent DNA helicase RecG [Rhodospirillaceae bacterium]|tara:strand:+ start:1678 stop:3762 length:2085 start_codon:yes stop_codon:yes gene_type:complete
MRPNILFPIFSDVKILPGIGSKLEKILDLFIGKKIIDLLWHLPCGIINRNVVPSIEKARPGEVCTITLKVCRHVSSRTRNQPYRIFCEDDTGEIELIFFHSNSKYLKTILPIGCIKTVSGKVEPYMGKKQISHPDHIVDVKNANKIKKIEPIYPLTSGLTSKILLKSLSEALNKVPKLPEWQNKKWLMFKKWPSWDKAIKAVHSPHSEKDLDPLSPSRSRLAFDEILANQLALALVRRSQRAQIGREFIGKGYLLEKGKSNLSFDLTRSQEIALSDVCTDLESADRTMRILQGDVGSGKTVVAFLSMLKVIECGAQTALMAPTEVLARQHCKTIQDFAKNLKIEVALLTGRLRGKERSIVLEKIRNGSTKIIIGTHALFQDEVEFFDLGFAVIDEQHRFGVHQRLMLGSKGKGPVDILIMTATPIPRTLMLSCYSDLDTSKLIEKPSGRKPVETRIVPQDRIEKIFSRIRETLNNGSRIYWICPLVKESEKIDVSAATERCAILDRQFPNRVALLHGQMKSGEKNEAIKKFSKGEVDILVATTIVEVGIDVPEANIMVIEHAERFGLAQLHQLRGRVGRGRTNSFCLLVYGSPMSEIARSRLEIMRKTEDGFKIAEEDLRLRGSGEVLGTKQSGFPGYRLADLVKHNELLEIARDETKLILEKDPYLKSKRGEALKMLLYLFERDTVAKILGAG